MENKKGYFYVRQDEENEGQWNIHKNEDDKGYPIVKCFETQEKAEFSAYYHYNRPIRDKLISDLRDELSKAFMVEESYFHLSSFEYMDPTYEVTYKNDVGTEFSFVDIYFNEEKLEILQRRVEVRF